MANKKQAEGVEKKVWDALATIPDPELHISIVDLGLVYDVAVESGNAQITMTLTTIGCPLFGTIEASVQEVVKDIESIKGVSVNLVFDPPWSMDHMSDEAKVSLGLV